MVLHAISLVMAIRNIRESRQYRCMAVSAAYPIPPRSWMPRSAARLADSDARSLHR